jgi:hypothetical protein
MTKLKLTAIAALALSLFVTSCKKDVSPVQNEKSRVAITQTQNLITNDPIAIYNTSRELHNEFLNQEYLKIKSGEIHDLNSLREFGIQYFSGTSFEEPAVLTLSDEFYSGYGSDAFKQNMLNVIAGNSRIHDLQQWVESNVADPLNMPAVDVFQSAIDGKLQEVLVDDGLTAEEKGIAAAVLGIASGSYEYWNNNIFDWAILKGESNAPPAVTMGRARSFFMEDCRGGSWGGLIGSFLPAVGNVAGAIMGGAIMSGAEALSW